MKKIIPSIFIILITALLATVLIAKGKGEEEYIEFNGSIRFPAMEIKINDRTLQFDLYENETSDAFYLKVKEMGSLTLTLSENGGFEKYGDLGFSLPTNDITTTLTCGEVAIYQSNKVCLFYGSNTYSYTKIGKIKFITEDDLKELLGEGDITITFDFEPTNRLF